MKPLMWLGSVLTALGIVALIVGQIRYTSHEKVPRQGAVQIIINKEKVISVPRVVSGVVTAAGITVMILAARK